MKRSLLKISLLFNIIIIILVIAACVIMFTGFQFMEGDLVLDVSGFGMLQFFTVDSNILMGLVALIFAVKEINILKGKLGSISTKLYIFKLMGTVGVTVTFLTVVCYLGQIVNGGLIMLLKNSNLFFHLIIPVLSIITFVCFERTDKIKFKNSLWGIIPVCIYALVYLTNVLIHVENGAVSPKYDWYWFVQGGLYQAFFVLPLMLIGTYIVSIGLWVLNHIKNK